nr:hypothetical protein [Tanacetum cinerariifolium]
MAIETTLVLTTTTEVVVMIVNLIGHPPKTEYTGANSHVKPDLEAMENLEAYYGDNALHVGKALKSDVYSTFKSFVQMVERQFTTKLKNVQTDWGGEFRNLASFFFSLGIIHRRSCPHTRAARRLEKEPPHSITTWEDLVSKFINEFFPPSRTTSLQNEILNFQQKIDESFHEAWDRYKDLLRACPHHGFTELHQLNTFYNALNPADQDSLNAAAGGNLLERSTQDVLTIIENKSKVCNSRSKPIASQVKACNTNSNFEIAKLTHAVNQQTSAVTTAMTAMLKQFQATPSPAPVKAVKEIYVTCRSAHPYYQCLAVGNNTFPEFRDNIQGYVSAAAVNYNHGNLGYRPQGVANQMRPPGFAQSNVQNNQNRFGPPQGFNRGNNSNHEQSYQATAQQNQNFHLNELEKIKRMNETSLSNQTNEIKNMMASLLQMNIASTSGLGSLPSNTVANPKGELKAITTRRGLVTDGPTVPTPSKSITPKVDERVEETYTDPNLAEYTIKKMLKSLLSNKEKLQELANTPLNENCSAVILKKLPEKLGDPGKFLIPCGFIELKCKALANLGASINLMPLSVWKKLGLPELIPTRMSLELPNRAICTPTRIARDVFVPVGNFTFPADFVIVDYEGDPRVPLIKGRPFLQTARALIDVHGEEMILRDGDERLTLNMKHDTSSYSNQPQRESVNLINIFYVSSEDFLDVLFSNQPSGNPTFSPHQELTSSEVTNDIFDSEGCNILSEKLPDLNYTKDLHPPLDDNLLSGSTTYSSNSFLEEFTDKLTLITYPSEYDDNLQFDIKSDLKEIEFQLYQDKDSSLKDSIDQKGLANLDAIFVDLIPEMFTDEHTLDYSSPLKFDVYDDDFLEVESDAENDFSRVDALPSANNEHKVFNPGIIIQEKTVKIITRVVQDKKLAISNASLVLEDFDHPFYEPLLFKEVPTAKMLLPFSSENEENVFKLGIHTSEKVHFYFIPELSYPGYQTTSIPTPPPPIPPPPITRQHPANLRQNPNIFYLPRASNTNVVDGKWVYRLKRDKNGIVTRYKARFAAKGNNKGTIDNTICQHGSAFTLKDLRPLNYFLGIEIVSHVFGILLSQKKSILELLQSAGLSNYNPVSSLMVTSSSFSLDDIKRILRYLHGTVEHGMLIRRSSGDLNDRQSTGRFAIYLGSNLISWTTRKHRTTLCSSQEAEYKDLADIVVELTWLQALLNKLGICSSSTPILWCDNLGNNKGTIDNIYCQLGSAFALKDLGPLNYFLGIEIVSHVFDILLSRKKSILKLLQSAGLSNCNLVSSPMLTSSSLCLDDSTAFSNPVKYRQVVGSLQYVTLSRPDMAFAVNKVCQYMHALTEIHWSAIKQILLYLHGTVERDDRWSTRESAIYLGSNLISWTARKQRTISCSSPEAEYRDLADIVVELTWLQALLNELGICSFSTPILWCDNLGATYLSANPIFHARTKHVKIDYHFVRISLQSHYQLLDSFF